MNRCRIKKTMPGPKKRDEQEALKLDEIFKEILAQVRPYIVKLTCKDEAQFCKVWLEKLSAIPAQRQLRNEYLLELYRQLSVGRIESIFRKPPPNNALIPLPACYRKFNLSSSLENITDSSSGSYCSEVKTNLNRSHCKLSRSRVSLRRQDTDSTSNASLSFLEDNEVDKTQLQLYRQRIEAMTDVVQELQIQNERLHNELFQCQEKISASETPSLRVKVKQLTEEILVLKNKLKEVQQMKDVLEENHREVVQQCQETMRNQFNKLKARLHETQNQNDFLEDKIISITQELEQVNREKEEKVKIVEKEWSKKYDTFYRNYSISLQKKDEELELKDKIINQKEAELTHKNLEKKEEIISLINQIKEVENKLDAKIDDKGKLQNMLTEQYSSMKEAFEKMRNCIEFTSQRQNETLMNENAILQKNISKLSKSKERLNQKFSQVIKDKELEIKSLQIKLHGQRSELSMSINSEKQNDLNSLVNILEHRYNAILAAVDLSADNQRQNYLKMLQYDQHLTSLGRYAISERMTHKISKLEHQVSHLKKTLVSLPDRR